MKPSVAILLPLGVVMAACAPYPPAPPAPIPLVASRAQIQECLSIRSELARQQRIAAYSGVMNGPLVQGAVLINVSNVVTGLQERAALAGCPI